MGSSTTACLTTVPSMQLVIRPSWQSLLQIFFLREMVRGRRSKSTTSLVVGLVMMARIETFLQLFAMGMVMMTLGEKANESSLLEGMVMHGVNVTLVVKVKLVALGMVTLCKLIGLAVTVTLAEKANESSVVEEMVIQGMNVTLVMMV